MQSSTIPQSHVKDIKKIPLLNINLYNGLLFYLKKTHIPIKKETRICVNIETYEKEKKSYLKEEEYTAEVYKFMYMLNFLRENGVMFLKKHSFGK